jgi:DMSO/TMAO reductase YedYZ molybdopterin-dependent catalytic subunit
MTRRELLFLTGAGSLLGQAPASSEPQNLSYPLQSLTSAITPPDLFFVRDHFREPELSLRAWTLKVEGRVAHPLELSMADLLESPTRKLEAVLECAGNAAGGSAVSNAVWEGAPLADVLRQAGAAPDAVSVLLEGADSGRLMQDSPALPYCQLMPASKCMQPESLLAFKLNGAFLPRRNGFPVRALFPGWYAMDSVKWLRRILVLGPGDQASDFEASGMNQVYNRIVKPPAGDPKISRLTGIAIKSAIAWPAAGAKLPVGRHLIRGYAWTGAGLVRSVDFSSDGGATWTPAQLDSRPKNFSWVAWSYHWSAAPGDHVLMSRATGADGRRQPLARDPARKDGYELNFCAPVPCSVR